MDQELEIFIYGYYKDSNCGYCVYFACNNIKYISQKINEEIINRRKACLYGIKKLYEVIVNYKKYKIIKCYINSNHILNILKNETIEDKDLLNNYIKYKNKIEYIYIDLELRKNDFINKNYNFSKKLVCLLFENNNLSLDFDTVDNINNSNTIVKINKKKKKHKKKIKIQT